MVLDHSKPHQKYFERICAIPHVSYNEKALSDYIVSRARELGYWHHQDELHNVIVRVPASPGYEDSEPLMLQGHMDMVGTKLPDCGHDFDNDPLQLYVEDGVLRARGTTLGADDGVAVAYMLAIMDEREAPHPPLDCVFTVQEEVGCVGARATAESGLIRARRMIGLDAAGEHVTVVGNYCSDKLITDLPLRRAPLAGERVLRLELSGIAPPSFGLEALDERANAVKYLAWLLQNAGGELRLISLCGGTAENAHPLSCTAELAARDADSVRARLTELTDKGLRLELTESAAEEAFDAESTAAALAMIGELPNGTIEHTDEYMLTSNLIGMVETTAEGLRLTGSTRCRSSELNGALLASLRAVADKYGARQSTEVRYRSWDYMASSPLREFFARLVRSEWGREIREEICPGGLEISDYAAAIPGLDAIAIGPLSGDYHVPAEWLDLASFDRVYDILLKMLENLK